MSSSPLLIEKVLINVNLTENLVILDVASGMGKWVFN